MRVPAEEPERCQRDRLSRVVAVRLAMADYGINIGVNVQSGPLTKLTQQLKQLRAIEKDLIDIQKSGTVSQKKVSEARRAAKDEINANKKAALDAAKAFNEQTGILEKGTAALREQEKQFRAYRAGAKKAKDGWTTFTQAIVKTNFSAAFGELKALNREAKATAETFNLMARGGGGVSFARGASIQDLLAFKPANTTNALNAYGNALENVLVDVDRGSEMFRELAARIAEVNRQLSDTSSMKGVPTTMYRDPIGPKQRPGFFSRMRQSTRFRDIATGGGFPLLFGGGPLQALAGGIGGGAAGLGGAIAASALASQIEAFAVSAAQAGQALQSTGGALEFVREKSLFSSAEAENLAAELEKQGKVQELATLLTNELTDVIGTSGLIALQDLGATTDETTKLWNQLTTQLQILISGPLNGFLELVNKILGAVNEGLKPTAQQDFVAVRNRVLKSGTAEQIAQIQAIEAQVRGTRQLTSQQIRKGFDPTGPLTEAGALTGLELAEKAGLTPKIAVTKEDLRTITPPGSKAAGGVTDSEKAAAALRKAQEKLQIMQQEGSLARELKKLDFERATEIDKINKLESATTEERLAATDATNKLFEARKGDAIGKALGEDLQKAIKLKEAQEDVLRPLEDQRRLLEGKLEGKEEEVRLQLEIEKILRSVEGLNEKDVEAAVRKNAALEEQVKQVERLEKLYQQVGSAIENALVDGIMAAIDGTKSLQSIVSSLLKDVGKMFLQFGIKTALNSVSPSVFPMAQGGFVSSPTRALVGEGGQGEYVIPENKMRESMARYSRGARGAAVVPGAGGSGTSGEGGGVAVAAPIDVRYTVERINSVDYVTADQFQAGMRRAADEGAKQGEQKTLKRLQMSSGTRKRLGM